MRWAGCFAVALLGCKRPEEAPPRPVTIAPEFVVGQQPVRNATEGPWPVPEALRLFPGRAGLVALTSASAARTFPVRGSPATSTTLALGVLLRAGQCYVLGAVVEPRQYLGLRIYNHGGALHRQSSGVPVAWIADQSLCPRSTGLRRVEVELLPRADNRTVTVQLFRDDATTAR